MIYKTEKLKARIVEKYGTQKAFAEALGMTEPSLSRLLTNGKDWKASMIMKAIDLLEIPSAQVDAYFFEPAVSKEKQEEAAR